MEQGTMTMPKSFPKTVQRILQGMGHDLLTKAIKEMGGLVADRLRARFGDYTDNGKREMINLVLEGYTRASVSNTFQCPYEFLIKCHVHVQRAS